MSVQKIAGAMTRQTNAVVVSAGLMEKTVKVRVGVQKWNKHIGKVRLLPPPFSSPLLLLIPKSLFCVLKHEDGGVNERVYSISTAPAISSSTTLTLPSASAM